MILRAFLCLALLMIIGVVKVQADEIKNSSRLKVCLNGDWLRFAGGNGESCPDEGWETVRVPEFHEDALKGSAWFQLDFNLPGEFGGDEKRILLRFIRVRHYTRVLLNGQECGENYGSRAPFEIDITEAAKVGQKNRLQVWVHECSGAYAMKGKTIEDIEILKRLSTFERYRETATIAEDVFLLSRPTVHVSDVLTMPSVREKSLSVRLTVTNDSEKAQSFNVTNSVFLAEDRVLNLPEHAMSLNAGESKTITLSAQWENPELWGYPPYGEPILYHLETRLTDDGGVIDGLATRFGFREIWTEEDKIILNGKPIRILGYWMPEGSGRSVWTWRMAAIQWAGCNAIHNHAEQREPAYYDVADELGMLVWDADFCGGPLGTTRNMSSDPFPDVEAEMARQYVLWAKTVANHPSAVVLMMGCLLNNDQVLNLAKAYRNVDPTRLLHGGGDTARPPLDLAAYASNFAMVGSDPLSNIRESYTRSIDYYSKYEGKTVPVINKEIWYNPRNPETNEWENVPQEKYAQATRDAILYLAESKLAGFILYSQQGFGPYQDLTEDKIKWPSRSGESQHPTSGNTGGMGGWPREFVNFFDSSIPAFDPLPTAKAMREAASVYVGHQVPVAKYRRPEVIVTVTAGGKPLPDAFVYAVSLEGAPAILGMRTDRDGKAWFSLQNPGRYQFQCRVLHRLQSVELDAPLQPLDIEHGGVGKILRVDMEL